MPSPLVVAPTLMAEEMQAGAARRSRKPSLPEEITVGIPAARRASIAALVAELAASQAVWEV